MGEDILAGVMQNLGLFLKIFYVFRSLSVYLGASYICCVPYAIISPITIAAVLPQHHTRIKPGHCVLRRGPLAELYNWPPKPGGHFTVH